MWLGEPNTIIKRNTMGWQSNVKHSCTGIGLAVILPGEKQWLIKERIKLLAVSEYQVGGPKSVS